MQARPGNAGGERVARIRQCLAALQPVVCEIADESAQHAGHAGAGHGGHYRLHLVSARFAGLSRVERHRLVYHALRDLLKRDIHALAMTLLAPEE